MKGFVSNILLCCAFLLTAVSAAVSAQSNVYFTKEITPESLVKIYEALGVTPTEGQRVAVKISTGDNATPLQNRITQLHGTHTVSYAEQIGLGSQQYNLIDLDTSGIDGASVGNAQLYNVYDLSGVKVLDHARSLDSLQSGVYVINGKTQTIK